LKFKKIDLDNNAALVLDLRISKDVNKKLSKLKSRDSNFLKTIF